MDSYGEGLAKAANAYQAKEISREEFWAWMQAIWEREVIWQEGAPAPILPEKRDSS